MPGPLVECDREPSERRPSENATAGQGEGPSMLWVFVYHKTRATSNLKPRHDLPLRIRSDLKPHHSGSTTHFPNVRNVSNESRPISQTSQTNPRLQSRPLSLLPWRIIADGREAAVSQKSRRQRGKPGRGACACCLRVVCLVIIVRHHRADF